MINKLTTFLIAGKSTNNTASKLLNNHINLPFFVRNSRKVIYLELNIYYVTCIVNVRNKECLAIPSKKSSWKYQNGQKAKTKVQVFQHSLDFINILAISWSIINVFFFTGFLRNS